MDLDPNGFPVPASPSNQAQWMPQTHVHQPHIHQHHVPHFHLCGCTYLTDTFFHDHVMWPAQCQFPRYHFTPFKYVGNYEPDADWPAREPSIPSHRTMAPAKSAFLTWTGVKKTVRFVEGDLARCAETGKPVPPPQDPRRARRRWFHANACLALANSVAFPLEEQAEQLPWQPPPTDWDLFMFTFQDMEVEKNLRDAGLTGHQQTIDAIVRGILDLLMFVNTNKAPGTKKLIDLVNRKVTYEGMVGSYTGDELIFAERAWSHTVIPLSRYANPSTAMSYCWTTPPAAYMVGDNAITRGLISEKTRQRILQEYETDKRTTV
ncbi:hypothetical protein EDB81DRAFT_854789 [Dactylonectria macrodidyma]|uniref:Uncharacterized protein n=1 Tax=Dactylonectria macrodidyma TaxID=307937 RepID=A0A9P9FA18_9HYPO|nr:hypothetical protein EDB81DRAFT_854789 [Dactylonectria macrodidyma]